MEVFFCTNVFAADGYKKGRRAKVKAPKKSLHFSFTMHIIPIKICFSNFKIKNMMSRLYV